MSVEETTIRDVLTAYLDGWDSDDPEALAGLFATDAVWEDPVGSEPVRGIENIRPIYRKAQAVTRVVPDGDIRTSHGNAGAMAFTIHTEIDGTPYEIKAVDVITLDADGKIQSLKAYWGPSDIRPLQ